MHNNTHIYIFINIYTYIYFDGGIQRVRTLSDFFCIYSLNTNPYYFNEICKGFYAIIVQGAYIWFEIDL